MFDETNLIGMNQFQLRAVRAAVDKRLITLGGMSAIPPTVPAVSPRSAFKHGDMIEFDAGNRGAGGMRRATIKRLNDKTISCVDNDTRSNWRVPYRMARLVGADKIAPAATPRVPMHSLAGGASTAPGAGAW